ncbi:MAG: hypothetical protein K9N46_11665 [Candidatus Marinimicrobia bacterium]|nr:hypothetical protein [Candidatus Neomarinimicrobiota bacterium]MCF7827381.1 hypothetical protein [Candidatus Neomarinimicrobiota bacterium]MCF7881386.1 hypothetical protein [Candidatus Neomarinimicrobiota bacterium]
MKSAKRLLLIMAFTFLYSPLSAQVSISPTSLFIDSQQKFATLLVMNGTNSKQEVSLEFPFAYTDADSAGNIEMIYDDSGEFGQYSIAGSVKGFPRNFILEPGQRQTIRLTVRPNKSLNDGVYWTRIKTISNPESPPVGQAEEGQINPQITFQFEQVTTLFYKVGKTSTGLDITDAKINIDEGQGAAIADVDLQGNSPYLGSMNLEVKDGARESVLSQRVFVSIYVDDARRLEFDASELEPGDYTATITFKTERADIPREDIVQAPPVSKQVKFTVQ